MLKATSDKLRAKNIALEHRIIRLAIAREAFKRIVMAELVERVLTGIDNAAWVFRELFFAKIAVPVALYPIFLNRNNFTLFDRASLRVSLLSIRQISTTFLATPISNFDSTKRFWNIENYFVVDSSSLYPFVIKNYTKIFVGRNSNISVRICCRTFSNSTFKKTLCWLFDLIKPLIKVIIRSQKLLYWFELGSWEYCLHSLIHYSVYFLMSRFTCLSLRISFWEEFELMMFFTILS